MTKPKFGFDYLNTLTAWSGREKNFSLIPITQVLKSLGNPQDKFRSIHVAGTNGKGSTSLMMSAVLGACGYRVGLNISPHLQKINERFVIDGRPVTDEWINYYALRIKEVCETTNVTLSYHETLTAIAFLGFYESKVDFGVIEVGLGGRLDASNVLRRPEVSIITSIGYDHQDILGETLPEIAKEKAGIIKNDSKVVLGDVDIESSLVIEEMALTLGSPIYKYQKDFSWDGQIVNKLALKGRHQVANANLVVKAAHLLSLDEVSIFKGLQTCFWPGRLEHREFERRRILIDCAHNPQGTQSLIDYLNENTIKKVHLIYGTLDTKDWRKSLKLLGPLLKSFAYLEPDSPRALGQNTMREEFSSCVDRMVPQYYLGTNYHELFSHIDRLNDTSLIVITGSIYLVGALRAELTPVSERKYWERTL